MSSILNESSRMFFVQTSTLPRRIHRKITENERSCVQNNQLPPKSHVELEDNDSPSLIDCRKLSATGLWGRCKWSLVIVRKCLTLELWWCYIGAGRQVGCNCWHCHWWHQAVWGSRLEGCCPAFYWNGTCSNPEGWRRSSDLWSACSPCTHWSQYCKCPVTNCWISMKWAYWTTVVEYWKSWRVMESYGKMGTGSSSEHNFLLLLFGHAFNTSMNFILEQEIPIFVQEPCLHTTLFLVLIYLQIWNKRHNSSFSFQDEDDKGVEYMSKKVREDYLSLQETCLHTLFIFIYDKNLINIAA